jgi:hypothetical protein
MMASQQINSHKKSIAASGIGIQHELVIFSTGTSQDK